MSRTTSGTTSAVETPATLVGSQIDMQAHFADEKLLRDSCITSGQPEGVDGPWRHGRRHHDHLGHDLRHHVRHDRNHDAE